MLAVALALFVEPVAAAEARPNILFIFSDDHAAQAISAYGSKLIQTPHLDRLAQEGMIFRNCFCTNSICAPSRAVVLTGKHSHLNGVLDNSKRFDGNQPNVAKLLRAAGYQTALIGKWHLKSDPTGFDQWAVLSGAGGQGTYYNPEFKTDHGPEKIAGYTTQIITDRALDWLQQQRDPAKPFFLCYWHKAPHREWTPGPEYYGRFRDDLPEPPTLFDDYAGRTTAARQQEMMIARDLNEVDLKLKPLGNLTPDERAAWDAAYKADNEKFRAAPPEGQALVRWKYQRYIKDYLRCVAAVDDAVGRVLDYLDRTGLADNTLVVYSSDQGFFLGEHGWFDKRWMYEESLRMPLLVRWPGQVKPGSEDTHLVQNLDFAETFLAAAGAAVPDDMQGASLLPLLRGESPADWRQSIYYQYYEFPAVHMVQPHYGVRTATHKLIRYPGLDEWELFDLQADPDELSSVYGQPAVAEIQAQLTAELARLRQSYHVPEK
ncbi:MAG: sulfatase [Pirellulales bacterium]|nr:sulfatase [Pirellulales bacterium]